VEVPVREFALFRRFEGNYLEVRTYLIMSNKFFISYENIIIILAYFSFLFCKKMYSELISKKCFRMGAPYVSKTSYVKLLRLD
jgi:hypothetical protein